MATKTAHVSAFSSAEDVWLLLEKGFEVQFKEYEHSTIPYDFMRLNSLDVVTRWKTFPRNLFGLQQALILNAERLIEWKYRKWESSPDAFSQELNPHYLKLVRTYANEVRADLSSYFGINRVIEASSCYSRFLIDESTLLKCYELGHIFSWQSRYDYRLEGVKKPEKESVPASHCRSPEIIESTDVYRIERTSSFFSGDTSRNTVVSINNVLDVDAKKLVYWLNAGYVVEYLGKRLCGAEDDGTVFGTDSYGQDFYAGIVSSPAGILESLQRPTSSERHQEHSN